MGRVVELEAAVVTSDGYPLLAGVDFTVDGPSVSVLTGPNGAGKTSLLRLLAGLVPLARGRGEVLGHDLAGDRRALRREVGWLGHDGSFYDDLTVHENLRFATRAVGLPVEWIEPALARVELSARADVGTRQLSAGQRRRLGLAWLLVRRPSLWLLDEPYASLDDAGRAFLDDLLLDVVGQGVAVVLSAHTPLGSPKLTPLTYAVVGGRVVGAP